MASVESSIQSFRDRLAPWRQSGSIGLVPTMGALHAGHASLMDRARAECGRVAVSIFVNPLQFDRDEDLARYPRQLQADVDLCASHGVDVVFAPDAAEMYRHPPLCTIDVGTLADHLCGARRPGHFGGVATIVMKLLQVAQPDRAYFGEKDAQQLAIIKRLVDDFNVPTTIVPVPTVREPDGLALSSRNQHLSPEERRLAPVLHAALAHADAQATAGVRDTDVILRAARATVPADSRLRLEYLEIVDVETIQPVPVVAGPVLIAGALWVGSTRLIDNVVSVPPGERLRKRVMKLRTICKSKIHHAVVTAADLHYVGSIGIDRDLMKRTDIVPGEQVSVWNVNNGQRIETYAIEMPEGSGQIVVNGAAARHFHQGDTVIIVAFCLTDEAVAPKMILVDEQNRFAGDLVDARPGELARR